MSDTNPTALTPDHMQEIRERLNSTLAVRKSDAEALLAEADRLRAESDQLYSDLTGAYLDRWEESQDNIRLRLALASAQRGRRELRARVAELEARPSRAEVWREAADALEARVADVDVDTRATWAGMDASYLRHMADEIEAGTPAS